MHSRYFKSISASKEVGYEMVAFGDAEDGSTDYVLLQLASEFDHQDRHTGMDGVYLEINDQAHGGYKVVHRLEVVRNAVIIHFSPHKIALPDEISPFRILHANTEHLSPDVIKALATMAGRVGIVFNHKLT